MSDQPVGDDKNWTWVLERSCADCGFDPATIVREDLGNHIRANAARFRALLDQGEEVHVRPPSDEGAIWSALEYGAHVRDVYEKFYERFVLMLTEDDPAFENWDQDVAAIEKNYAGDDPGKVAYALAANAGKLADLLDKVKGDQWQRKGFRSDGSAFTVESLGTYLLHDPVHHAWDVDQGYEALGVD